VKAVPAEKKNEGALEVMIVGINNDMKWG